MSVINIQVRRKKAASPVARIVCGNSDYKISFNFDKEWDAHPVKTARFIWNGQFVDVVFNGTVCDVPVLANTDLVAVGVYAGDLRTTTPALIACDKSILCGEGQPADPPPNVYAQIMELLNSSVVTPESISAALGYTPASEEAVRRLSEEKDALAEEVRELSEDIGDVELLPTVEKIISSVIISSTLDQEEINLSWELGAINGTNDMEAYDRIRTTEFYPCEGAIITAEDGCSFSIRLYNADKVYQGMNSSGGWLEGTHYVSDINETASGVYFRIVAKHSDNSVIADINDLVEKITVAYIAQNTQWELGAISGTSYMDSDDRMRTTDFYTCDGVTITAEDGCSFSLRLYNANKGYLGMNSSGGWLEGTHKVSDIGGGPDAVYFKVVAKYTNGSKINDVNDLATKITAVKTEVSASKPDICSIISHIAKTKIHNSQTGNVSIVCAKEFTYNDGTPPKNEYFLVEECGTNKFYISKDLSTKEYAFTFEGNASLYTFGILQNGDVIAVRFAETLEGGSKSDNNRVNPFVFLASENWRVQHEVDFGEALKPCGWLSNCGFRVLPDGTCLFCEYTRQTTETANVWRLTGNPLDSKNWVAVKSFPITSTDNNAGFKHIHTVQYDHFADVTYVATGDDDVGAMVFYSLDAGLTWVQLLAPGVSTAQNEYGWYGGSQQYCRLLNFTFTEDHIYWASDTSASAIHYLFKAQRDVNGVLDYGTVVDFVHLPNVGFEATYGTAYLPEINAVLLLDRADGNMTELPIKLVELESGNLITVGKLYSPSVGIGKMLGFRTRYSEWYPFDGLVRIGYALEATDISSAVNPNKGFGNGAYPHYPHGNINNLSLTVRKHGDSYSLRMDTNYL